VDLQRLLDSIIEQLSAEPKPVLTLAAGLGECINDWAPGLPAILKPHHPSVREAQIIPVFDGSQAEQVWLRFTNAAQLHVRDLKKAYGEYRKIPGLHMQSPVKLAFEVDLPTHPYTCSLVAELDGEKGALKNRGVAALTLARDIRL